MSTVLDTGSVTITPENKDLQLAAHKDLKKMNDRLTGAETTDHTTNDWSEVDWTKQPDGPTFYTKDSESPNNLKQGIVFRGELYYTNAQGQMIREAE